MKIVVLTLFTPEIASYGELAARNKKDYAAIRGYDLIVHRATLDPSRPPAWSKVPAILDALKSYDGVFWTDSDALIMNHAIHLEDIFDENFDLIIARDKRQYNTGQMLLQNTSATRAFLEKTYAQTQFINETCWEQTAMAHLLDSGQSGIRTKIIEQRVFNSYLENYQAGDFVIHFPRPLEKVRRMDAFYRRSSLVIQSKSQWPGLVAQFQLLNMGMEIDSQRPEDFADASLDWLFLNSDSISPQAWLPKIRVGGLVGGLGRHPDVPQIARLYDATTYLVDGPEPIWYLVKAANSPAATSPPVIQTSQSSPMPRILIQGWRAVPHPLAIVGQYHCLQFLNEPEIFVHHQDLPFPRTDWHKREGILAEKNEIAIYYMPETTPGYRADATYRIAWPFDFSTAASGRTVVFTAADFKNLPPGSIMPGTSLKNPDVQIVTPSNWSKEGLLAAGADGAGISIIPFGFDPAMFHPISDERRSQIRRAAGGEGNFFFHYVAGDSPIENLPLVLRAFAATAEIHPRIRLLLRGADGSFPVGQILRETAKSLSESQIALIHPRLIVSDGIFARADTAEMYHRADVLLSPYSGGAFNLPVLEAAACGKAVICTAGGAADEIITDQFALRISSRPIPVTMEGIQGMCLAPDFDHFVLLMKQIVQSPQFVTNAAIAAPRHVSENFTWKSVTEKLLKILLQK